MSTEDFAYNFEDRYAAAKRPSGAGKQMYTTRATRIEMLAREKRASRLKVQGGKANGKKPTRKLAGRKNRRDNAKKVRLDFHKVKPVVDPEKIKANKAWNTAHRPRDTRPWVYNEIENNEDEKYKK